MRSVERRTFNGRTFPTTELERRGISQRLPNRLTRERQLRTFLPQFIDTDAGAVIYGTMVALCPVYTMRAPLYMHAIAWLEAERQRICPLRWLWRCVPVS